MFNFVINQDSFYTLYGILPIKDNLLFNLYITSLWITVHFLTIIADFVIFLYLLCFCTHNKTHVVEQIN